MYARGILQFLASQVLYLALHLESGSFPRPLTPRQEVEAFAALRRGDADARDTIIRHNLAPCGPHRKKILSPCPAMRRI